MTYGNPVDAWKIKTITSDTFPLAAFRSLINNILLYALYVPAGLQVSNRFDCYASNEIFLSL